MKTEAVNALDITNYKSSPFKRFFLSRDRDVVLYGGAGSGKSYAVADKWAMEIKIHESKGKKIKAMIVRRSMPSLKRTCMPMISAACEKFGLNYHLNKQDNIATVGERSEIYYISVNNRDNYEKAKSITDIDYIWLEEANEIPLEVYQGIIKLRLRGGQADYAQRIFTFNPISRFIWLYDYHFINNHDKALKIQVNIEHNIFKDVLFLKELDRLKTQNYNLWDVYRRGNFGTLEGIIYPDVKKTILMPDTSNRFYGLDFGFNNPSALIEERDIDGEYYEQQLIYETGLTNTKLIARAKEVIPKELYSCPIYCDSAEPDRIKEFCDAGLNAIPAKKEVAMGIDYCQRQIIYMHEDSNDLIKENETYSWATDKDGKKIDTPTKYNDHLIDARRYALYTHQKKQVTGGKIARVKNTFKAYEH